MKTKANLTHLSINSAKGKKFGIVRSVWNDAITKRLYDGCYNTLLKHGAIKEHIKTLEVPGSFELIYGGKKMAKESDIDSVIVIGSIIKGETPHFDFISQATTNAIMKLSIDYKKPIGNGIITTLNKEQADKRSIKKGGEAAKAVISLLSE